MKLLLLLFVMLTAMTTQALAASGTLELYGDPNMASCTVTYSAPSVIQVHLFQTGDRPGATEFGLVAPPCLPGVTWLGDIIDPAFLTLGDTQRDVGIAVAFGPCGDEQMPIHIGYVNFFVTDLGVECCEFRVTDPPSADVGIRSVTCSHGPDFPVFFTSFETKSVVVNPNPECPCQQPLAVQQTTWGKVKALYR